MTINRLLTLGCLLGCASAVLADDFFVYPKNNQTAEQTQQDKNECYVWAKGETGFDPMAQYRTETAPPPQSSSGPDGSMARGAARGAALGAIVGNSDDARKGAAAGAAVGAMRRRDQRRQEQKDYERWEQEETAKYNEKRNRYNRAYKGCMEARDYSVS